MNKTGTETSSFGVGCRTNHDSTTFYSSKLYKELEKREINSSDYVEGSFPCKLLNSIVLRLV